MWQGTTALTAALGIVAETILLLDDAPLGKRIDAFFTDLTETQHRLREADRAGTWNQKERGNRHIAEHQRLQRDAKGIVDALRKRLARA